MSQDKHNLTIEEIRQEIKLLKDVENATGFSYFCNHYGVVSHPSKGALPLKNNMYKWQKEAATEFLRHKQIIYKKTRQISASTLTGLYALWRALFFEGQNVVIVSLTQRDSTEFLRRVKFSYDHLPKWLQLSTSEFAKSSITFEANGSKISAVPNGENPSRGQSVSVLVVDEFAAFKNPKALLAAALPSLSAGLLTPFSNKSMPSQLFIISTLPTNPVDNEYLRLLHYAQDNPDDSKFHLIDVDTSDISQYQSEEWHQTMKENLGDRLYKIEILGLEVYDMDNSLIPSYILEKMKPVSPIRTDFLKPDDIDEEGYYKDFDRMLVMKDDFDEQYNYMKGLWVWEDPIPGKQYFCISDVATGRAGDFSTAIIFDPESNSEIAEYHGKIDTERLKRVIEILCEYYNNAKLSIESTGLGGPVVEYFASTTMYQGLYWHRKSKKELSPGFPMSASNRANAIAIMQTMLVKGDIQINSVRMLNELRGFGYTKSGRLEALAGHDDLVMTLVQYCFLQHIGFAATDKMITSHLMFGDVTQEVKAQDEYANGNMSRTKKYWEDNGYLIDEHLGEMLDLSDAMGCTLTNLDVQTLINTWKN